MFMASMRFDLGEEVEAIRAYVIQRANEDKALEAATAEQVAAQEGAKDHG